MDPSGRSPAFHWSVSPQNDVAQGAPLSLAPPNATSLAAPVLRVGQADLAPGARFRFKVAVGTFLGASATASVEVEVADAPLPSVRARVVRMGGGERWMCHCPQLPAMHKHTHVHAHAHSRRTVLVCV